MAVRSGGLARSRRRRRRHWLRALEGRWHLPVCGTMLCEVPRVAALQHLIRCLQVLVLSGFRRIEIVDLDTIDVSNLNRQFLFRRDHVGQSKAAVAAKAVHKFNQDVDVTPHHGNIKDPRFGVAYMKTFDVIFNALDNIDARRHVNRICIAAERPLVDGGTSGYLGQVTTIQKGKTACYDCTPKPQPKGFPVCTIRSTPDKPIHCIVWGKHMFNLLFGVKDDDNSVAEVDREMDAAALVRKLFVDEINKLRGMEDLWKARKPPTPLDIDGKLKGAIVEEAPARSSLDDRTVWDVQLQVQVFMSRYRELAGRAAKDGVLSWDKDDDAAMDFVLCASNLRSIVFAIEMQTSFKCKQMAGNIIPAIATTNAIISGYMVLEAFKVIDQRLADCRAIYKTKSEPCGKKVKKMLVPGMLEDPNPKCPVCSGGSTTYLTVNTNKTSLDLLLRRVLKQELGLNEPILDTGENTIECMRFDDPTEQREFEERLKQKLSHPSVGLVDGTIVTVEDESQELKNMKIHITHNDEMDPESETAKVEWYLLSRGAPAPEPKVMAHDGGGSGASVHADQDDDDDCFM